MTMDKMLWEMTRLQRQNTAMCSALMQCEDYFDDRADVVDGSYGEPAPNAEMSLLTEIRQALAGVL